MHFIHKSFLIIMPLLSITVFSWEEAPQLSLWGKVADFTPTCVSWTLQNKVFIPALKEFTVCFSLQLESPDSSLWTAFVYRHPATRYAVLGLGGKSKHLIVWLFGMEFRTENTNPLTRNVWYDLCITWAEAKGVPALYLDGTPLEIYTDPPSSPSSSQFPSNGSLTIGASHKMENGHLKPLSTGHLKGKVSVFRMWSQERSKEEVTSMKCTEGGVIKWEQSQWDTATCAPVSDPSLECEWSSYEVKLTFLISRSDDKNSTDLYTAKAIAQRWLRQVLPDSVYLPRVSVFEDTLTSRSDIKEPQKDRWAKPSNRFRCLVHLTFIPGLDVAAAQFKVHSVLKGHFTDSSTGHGILANEHNIYVTAVDFSAGTTTPSTFTTPTSETRTSATSLDTFTSRGATPSQPAPPPATTATTTPTTTITTTSTTAASTTATDAATTATTTTPTITTTITTTSTTTASTTATDAATTTTTPTITTTPTTTITTTSTTAATTTATDASTTATDTATTSTTPTTTITTTITTAATTTATDAATTATTTLTTPTTTITTPTTTITTTITTAATTTATDAATTATVDVTEQSTFKIPTFPPTVAVSTATVTDVITTADTTALITPIATSLSQTVAMFYYEVQVNVSLTGVSDPECTISLWLNSSLPDNTMTVLDLQLLTKTAKIPHFLHVRSLADTISRESYVFQVEVSRLSSEPFEIEKLLQSILEKPFYNGSMSIEAEDILISRIFNFQCSAEVRHTREGLFHWPDTSGGRDVTLQCPKNPLHSATRHCKICMQTYWLAADTSSCPLVVEVIPDLDDVDVTTDNVQDIMNMIVDLLKNQSHLNYSDLATVLNKVEDIINVSVVTPPLGQALLDVISDVLELSGDLQPFTNMILSITESLGDRITGYDDSTILSAPFVGMSVVDVAPGHFRTLSFGVLGDRVELKPEIFINRSPLNGTVAYISLPSALQQNFPQNIENLTSPRIQFQFFGVPWLFKTKPSNGLVLNTYVVSASVTNASSPICDLQEDVQITLHHFQPNNNNKDVQCVYWNFNLNDGVGGWDPTGCRKYNSTPQYTTCFCDHLTHFGVLLDVSRTPLDPEHEYQLTIITYVGCGISSLFLGVTVLTYTAFEKLRRDYPSQILINLSLALLGLNLILLVNSWLSSWGVYGLCIFVATTMHYFVLASFTWMGLEAVNMYFALVKVFNVYVPSYILKFCALGWGIPLVVCVVMLIVDKEAYGSQLYTETKLTVQPLDESNNFCWIQDNVAFYVTVIGYAAVVFLFNTAVFIVVLIQIRRMRYNSPAGIHSGLMKDLKGVASLTLLVGLTWTIGFSTWGPARVAMLFLFSTLNSFQGLFIFIFHCLMKENVRKQWRIHLCFGRLRLEENSEWSASGSFGIKPKPPVAKAQAPSVRSVKSSSTESTSASSESSQRESIISNKRPDLGLFVTGLVIPRAQCISGPTRRSHGSLNPTPGWTNHLLTQEHS